MFIFAGIYTTNNQVSNMKDTECKVLNVLKTQTIPYEWFVDIFLKTKDKDVFVNVAYGPFSNYSATIFLETKINLINTTISCCYNDRISVFKVSPYGRDYHCYVYYLVGICAICLLFITFATIMAVLIYYIGYKNDMEKIKFELSNYGQNF